MNLELESEHYRISIEQAQAVLNELREAYLSLPSEKQITFAQAFNDWRKHDAEN